MKAVIYARYSSDGQREESIEGQVRECKAFAERKGLTVVELYIDRAISGRAAENRPEFQRLIRESAKKLFDVVIVWKLDRFARNRYDSAHYKAILRKIGVKVISATETISEGAEGIILESVLEGMAEYYSAELAEKMKRGQTENALKAKYNGGNVPYGYLVDSEQHYQPDPILAPVVREIFEKYADGVSVADIVRGLSARGIYTKNGGQISYNSFRNMLTNPRYKGDYVYGEHIMPGGIPAVVEPELWDRAQRRLEQNKRAPAKAKAKVEYLITTKLICGKCGAYMVGESGTGKLAKTYHYYKCLSAKRKRGCDKRAVKKDWIEDLAVRETVETVLKDSVVRDIAKRVVEYQQTEDSAVIVLRQELAETEKGLTNIVDAIQAGLLTPTTKQRLEDLEARKAEIEVKLLQAELERTMLTEEQVIFWINRFKNGDMDNLEYRQAMIDIFVNSVYVYDDRLVLTYNCNAGTKAITLDDVEVSDLPKCAPPLGTNANRREHRRFSRFPLLQAPQA
ncbi:MAG: recombinase family protein [Oscillospiraceae bacterium]|jgi:DNA invertase Pin-like site-specific DNA recombinase|nr:recombinase family protein [Oscillospiraceae bacterium]